MICGYGVVLGLREAWALWQDTPHHPVCGRVVHRVVHRVMHQADAGPPFPYGVRINPTATWMHSFLQACKSSLKSLGWKLMGDIPRLSNKSFSRVAQLKARPLFVPTAIEIPGSNSTRLLCCVKAQPEKARTSSTSNHTANDLAFSSASEEVSPGGERDKFSVPSQISSGWKPAVSTSSAPNALRHQTPATLISWLMAIAPLSSH